MAVKRETVSYFSLRNEIGSGKFHPIYVLQGEEPYYIDRLSELIVNTALTEDERDFNLSIYYGNEALVPDVINTCKQYPTFAERRVVVFREAQLVSKQPGHKDDLNLFALYAAQPLQSTILVVCAKGGTLGAKQFTDAIKKHKTGIVFDSAKVRDGRDLIKLAANYATQIGVTIDEKSASMLTEFIGNDLARLFTEIDKLKILATAGQGITPELIEKNVGISKDYNYFELEDALGRRDAVKAFRIVDYFRKNPKNNPTVLTITQMYGFFSSVLLVRTCRDRSRPALLKAAGTSSEWRLRKFEDIAGRYSTQALVNIIRYLRECDTKSKGINSRQDSYELLRELIYKILHS